MKVVLIALTRMGRNICVGVARECDGEALRLVPHDSPTYRNWRSFDAPLGSVLEIDGDVESRVDPPHVEDFLVASWRPTGHRVDDLAKWIESKASICVGGPDRVFGGLLQSTAAGSRYLDLGGELPTGSVEFWRLPFEIYHRDVPQNKSGCAYAAALRHSFRVKYVGREPEVESVPKGTLVRLSLSRPYSPTPEEPERCWLQLSGWYPEEGVEVVEKPRPSQSSPPEQQCCDDEIPF